MPMSADSGGVRLQRAPDPRAGTAVVELVGELDLAVAGDLRALLADAVQSQPELLVVDVAGVTFIDSTVLREILRAHQALVRAGGRLVVAGPQSAVGRLLQLTGTAELFSVAASREDALA